MADKQDTGAVTETVTPVVVEQTKVDPTKAVTTLADAGDEIEADGKVTADKAEATWPDDWRERLAGKDEAALKQLKRYGSVEGLWQKNRNLEKKLSERAAGPAKPGKDATPEDVAAYRQTIGLPDKVEAYAEKVKFADGVVIGETDKPIVDQFTKMAFDRHHSPEAVADFVSKYYEIQRQTADQQTEADDRFAQESRDALRDEWGAQDYKRNVNASAALFKEMPKEVADAVLTARTADGRLVGNIPDFVKWASSTMLELNGGATVFPSGGAEPGKTPQARLNDIRELRRNKPDEYQVNAKKFEAEEIELNDAIIRMQRRGKAA